MARLVFQKQWLEGKGDGTLLCDDPRCASVPAFGPFRGKGLVLFSRCLLCALLALAATGCARRGYMRRADRESYGLLDEKTACKPWALAWGFNIQPDGRSRFSDPTPAEDPELPLPSPHLYEYELPEVRPRDPARFGGVAAGAEDPAITIANDEGSIEELSEADSDAATSPEVRPVSYDADLAADTPEGGPALVAAVAEVDIPTGAEPGSDGPGTAAAETARFDPATGTLRVAPIPEEVWDSLPSGCLRRMFEFSSIRDEYDRTFDREPPPEQRDDSPRLALEDIVELALINSREYQAQKETLYRAALALSLERYPDVNPITLMALIRK